MQIDGEIDQEGNSLQQQRNGNVIQKCQVSESNTITMIIIDASQLLTSTM